MQKTVEKSMGRRAFKALRKAVRGAMKPGPDDGGDVVGRTPAGWYCDNCDRPKPTQKTPAERIAKLERLISYQKRELWLAEQEGRVPPGPGVFRARYEDTISRLSGQLSAAKAGA
jgi:hypothetical protein